MVDETQYSVVEVTSLKMLLQQRGYMAYMMDNFYKLRIYMDHFSPNKEVDALKEFLELSIEEALEEYKLLDTQIRSIPASEVTQ